MPQPRWEHGRWSSTTLPEAVSKDLPAQIRPTSPLLDVLSACSVSDPQKYLSASQNATAVIGSSTASLLFLLDLLHSHLSTSHPQLGPGGSIR